MAGKAGWDEAAWPHAARGSVAMVKAALLEPQCPTCKAHSTATAVDSTVPLDQEPLLPRLGVVRQRPVGEAEPVRLVHDVKHPAGVEPPDAEGAGHHRHHLCHPDGRLRGQRLHPAQAEMLPAPKRSLRPQEDRLPFAQPDPGAVHGVAGRRHGGSRPDRHVGQVQLGLRRQEVLDLPRGRLAEQEHRGPRGGGVIVAGLPRP